VQLLRSLLFTTYMMASACVFGGVMALGFWLPYQAQFALARTWARILLWVLERLCGLKYVVEGRERIPPGNHIVMSNHTSAWETVAQFLIFPPISPLLLSVAGFTEPLCSATHKCAPDILSSGF
jgi:1-acyl-sn-glycerol-3-phosphate acyltransferase